VPPVVLGQSPHYAGFRILPNGSLQRQEPNRAHLSSELSVWLLFGASVSSREILAYAAAVCLRQAMMLSLVCFVRDRRECCLSGF
jgi:hypothetical protein